MTRALEQTRELGRPLTPRCGERRVAAIVNGIRTSAGNEQAPDHCRVATQRRDEKCRASPSVGLFSADAAAEELIDTFEIPRLGRREQR